MTDLEHPELREAFGTAAENTFTKREWIGYYSRKRIVQQWMQLDLLAAVDCRKILEVGPAMGLVTSLLVNNGYEVGTLDRAPRVFAYPDVPHLEKDICELRGDEIAGYDAILCCETLEHIDWSRVGAVLAAFRASEARYLILSVPYMGFQIALDLYLNRTAFRQYFSMKKLLWRKTFLAQSPGGHQWEVGYRNYSLRRWEALLTESGWSIKKREFTEHCRSVFHLLEAK
jgi:hypothetical protein